MTKRFHDGIQWDVIQGFYQWLQHLTPGSREAEAIDHAITLALKTQRKVKNHFTFEILRNARYSKQRTYQRQRELYHKLNQELQQRNNPSPDEVYIAQDLENRIREAIAPQGERMTRCLEGMLKDETIADIAKACRISRRSVDRDKQKIREIVRPFFEA